MKGVSKKLESAICDILTELEFTKEVHPKYYKDVIHAVALVNEEAGEAIAAALDYTYTEDGSIEHIKKELIQTAAMCFRALENIENLRKTKRYL